MSLGLVLGGGAPNITLMSGALAALDERGVEFDVISSSGAGMLVGLLHAAPKNGNRQEALRMTQDMSVSDAINEVFPINYKVFQKGGPLADSFRNTTQPWLDQLPYNTPAQKLMKDWAALFAAALCPSDLSAQSTGLCEPAPWVTDVVDFDALRKYPGEFYVSAFNIDTHKMETFPKEEITADHFRASLSMPFIYPPFELNGQHYIEGCVYDTLNYKPLYERPGPKVKHAIVFDVLAEPKIIQKPDSLYEALNQMIIAPLVRLGIHDTKAMKSYLSEKKIGYHRLKFAHLIPEAHWPKVLDWSQYNMTTLYNIGYEAAERFYEEKKKESPDILHPKASTARKASAVPQLKMAS